MTSTGSRSVQPDTTWEGGGERAGHLQGVIEGSFAEYRTGLRIIRVSKMRFSVMILVKMGQMRRPKAG